MENLTPSYIYIILLQLYRQSYTNDNVSLHKSYINPSLGWDSIESRVYSDESPGGYSTNTTVDSVEYRVDTIESPLHQYKKQIINLNHLEMEYWKNSFKS